MSNLKLLVIQGGATKDMSNLVSKATWSGRKGAAARTLSITFIDDDGYKHERTGIDVEQGHQCIFYWKNKELFRGMFMKQDQSQGKTMTALAYDNGIYLANNKDTFNYSGDTGNKTASEIFADACKRFGIPTGSTADTKYKIPELPKPKTTAWDVVCDALSQTYKSTGVRYYVLSQGGKVSLLERRKNVLQWAIEPGKNLISYSQSKSIEKIKTRIKLLSSEDKVVAEAKNAALEKKIGIFQDVEQVKDELNSGQLNEQAQTTLAENGKPERALNVTALGIPEIISGIGVYVVIPHLNALATYYVEDDTHSFDGNYHEMKLKLVLATDTGGDWQIGT